MNDGGRHVEEPTVGSARGPVFAVVCFVCYECCCGGRGMSTAAAAAAAAGAVATAVICAADAAATSAAAAAAASAVAGSDRARVACAGHVRTGASSAASHEPGSGAGEGGRGRIRSPKTGRRHSPSVSTIAAIAISKPLSASTRAPTTTIASAPIATTHVSCSAAASPFTSTARPRANLG